MVFPKGLEKTVWDPSEQDKSQHECNNLILLMVEMENWE